MSRRTLILLSVLLALGVIALWRRVPAPDAVVRLREAEADAAARRFIALREAEDRADREVWSPTLPVARLEREMVLGVERAMRDRSLDSGVLPRLLDRLSAPAGYSLHWLQSRFLGVRPVSESVGRPVGYSAELEMEVVLERPSAGNDSRAIWTARFLAETDWSDGEPPRLLGYRFIGTPTTLGGTPVFEPWAELQISTNGVGLFTDPLILETPVQGPRLHLAGAGVCAVLDPDGRWRWEASDMGPPERVQAVVRADLDGDGSMETAVADASGLRVRGRDGWRPAWVAPSRLRHPQSICAGDIDGDGDLDLWITQYRLPFANGQFPTPYYDANDGFPSYLLRNDGARWVDITESSGLGAKRNRRTYSASWIDLDGDGDLDLVNVGDFAGLDLYRNDGRGRFTDLTPGLGETRHSFGMAHVIWDANGDALPDLLMVGMDSAVASQLEVLGLGRPEFPGHTAHRAAMTYGNRLFTGSATRGLEFSPVSEGLRRGGWAWGAAVLDWNNDGRDDVYLVNGHETFESRSDFERQFWQHDIYVGGSTPDPARHLYFMQANERRRAARQSYGGWQANRLFTASGPGSYVENAWTLGLAVTEDCRNVVAGDFDADGRMDLALTTYEQWPAFRQRLLIFRNRSKGAGRWIGYQMDVPAPGSRLELTTREGLRHHWWVNGAGYRSQSDTLAHFGLGESGEVIRAEWILRDGSRRELPRDPGRWHRIPGGR